MMSRNQPAKRGRKPKKTREAAIAEMMQASGQFGATQKQQQVPHLPSGYPVTERRTRAMSQYMQMQEALQTNIYASQAQQELPILYSAVDQHNNNMYAASTLQQQQQQQQQMYAMAQDPSMYSTMQSAAQEQNMYLPGTNQGNSIFGTPTAQNQHMYASQSCQVQQGQHNMFSAAAAAHQNNIYPAVATQHQVNIAAQVAAQAAAKTSAQEKHMLSSPVAPPAPDHWGYATAAHIRSPHAAQISSPHAAPSRSPLAAPTRSPLAAPTRSPLAAPTRSLLAAPTRSPLTAPSRSPHTAHTEQQRMAFTSNHILYSNMDLAHVPKTTTTYTVPEQLPELSSMQGRTSGYNLRCNARRMNTNQVTAPTPMDKSWNNNVPAPASSFKDVVNTRAAHRTPTISPTSAEKAKPPPQITEASTQTKLNNNDIQLITTLRRKRMNVKKLQVLVIDDEYTVTYNEQAESQYSMVDLIKRSNTIKSNLFMNFAGSIFGAGPKMLKANPDTDGISPISSPERNESQYKKECNESSGLNEEQDNVESSHRPFSGTPPQALEQNNRHLIDAILASNSYYAAHNQRYFDQNTNEQDQVPNTAINLLNLFPFNSMFLPPPES